MTRDGQANERLWGGRFADKPDEAVLAFMAGRDMRPAVAADEHLIADDLWASRAHVAMLVRQDVIPRDAGSAILDALALIDSAQQRGAFVLDPAHEDVHSAIETTVNRVCGPEIGAHIHTGRSRNDQVVTALRLYMRHQVLDFADEAAALARTLLDLAADYREVVMPGFTHYQPATPTTLGHILASYAEAFTRDVARLASWLDLHNYCPLGGAAGYGTTVPLDRTLVAAYLAFDAPHATSLDPIATRGEPETDLALALTQLLKHLGGLAQTAIVLGGPYRVLRLSPAYCSGSSIMPQKMNPDTMEVIKGKAATAIGAVSGLLAVGAGAFVGYNRDSQWSKYVVIDLVEETRGAASIMAGAWQTMRIDSARAAELAHGDFIGSAAVMEWLVTAHGVPLRRAKQVVEIAVRLAEDAGAASVTATALRRACEEQGISVAIDDEGVARVQDPHAIVAASRAVGGPAPGAVDDAIGVLRGALEEARHRTTLMRERIAQARERLYAEIQPPSA